MTFFASNQSNRHGILFSAGVSSDPNVEDCSKVPKTKMPWCRCRGRKFCSFLKTDGHVNDPHTNLYILVENEERQDDLCGYMHWHVHIHTVYKSKRSARLSVPCSHFRVSVAHVENISLLENSGCLLLDSLSRFSDFSPSRVNLLLFGIGKKSRPFVMPSSRGTVTCQKSEATRIFVGFVGATPERWVYSFFLMLWMRKGRNWCWKENMKKHPRNTLGCFGQCHLQLEGLTLASKLYCLSWTADLWSRSFGAKIVDIRNHPTTEW